GGNLPSCLDAVEVGHPDVHQHDVGADLARGYDRLRAGGGFTDDTQTWCRVDQQPETSADEGLVVGDNDADHAAASETGRIATTSKPPPSRCPARKVPRYIATRSRIPVSP